MRIALIVAAALGASLTSVADGANIYMLSSGDPETDSAAVSALTGGGHTVTVGVQYNAFDGSVNLASFDTVYLQCNFNWTTAALMPAAGQQQLIDWVNAGGRLVTSEWVVYYTFATGKFGTLASIIPAAHSFLYDEFFTATYSQVTPDPAINAGLPAAFDFPLTSFLGTECFTTAKAGATTYYETSNSPGAPGLVGWTVGTGSVYSIMSTCGRDQVGDPEFGLLFSNVMGESGTCYPDCNASGTLTVADFTCFQGQYLQQTPYADCNNSGTWTVADFTCFQVSYVAGCP